VLSCADARGQQENSVDDAAFPAGRRGLAGWPAAAPGERGLRHLALFYQTPDDYLRSAVGFLCAALDRDEPVFAAVPGHRVGQLRQALAADAGRVVFGDIVTIGRNPANLIPAVRAFLDRHPGERVSYLGEPAWPARSDTELLEAARNDALVNLAFADVPATIMCPYDLTGLPPEVLTDAESTHPTLVRRGASRPSGRYLGPGRIPPRCDQPLASPPGDARSVTYRADLRVVRDLAGGCAADAGLPTDRVQDLMLAVSEVAANTLRHTTAAGTLRVWHTETEIICQIDDSGWIADPLAGRVHPPIDQPRGHGLWLVNQVCDLVEVRTSALGSSIRLHLGLR
jgi:anti-sigma regulatory factor (Ser/Thr protein kinase)